MQASYGAYGLFSHEGTACKKSDRRLFAFYRDKKKFCPSSLDLKNRFGLSSLRKRGSSLLDLDDLPTKSGLSQKTDGPKNWGSTFAAHSRLSVLARFCAAL
jgi:hypothetical protein